MSTSGTNGNAFDLCGHIGFLCCTKANLQQMVNFTSFTCPLKLLPKPYTSPVLVMTMEWRSPQATCTIVALPKYFAPICAGSSWSFVCPNPNWPLKNVTCNLYKRLISTICMQVAIFCKEQGMRTTTCQQLDRWCALVFNACWNLYIGRFC